MKNKKRGSGLKSVRSHTSHKTYYYLNSEIQSLKLESLNPKPLLPQLNDPIGLWPVVLRFFQWVYEFGVFQGNV